MVSKWRKTVLKGTSFSKKDQMQSWTENDIAPASTDTNSMFIPGFGSNDINMTCYDGEDYSMYHVLYNINKVLYVKESEPKIAGTFMASRVHDPGSIYGTDPMDIVLTFAKACTQKLNVIDVLPTTFSEESLRNTETLMHITLGRIVMLKIFLASDNEVLFNLGKTLRNYPQFIS